MIRNTVLLVALLTGAGVGAQEPRRVRGRLADPHRLVSAAALLSVVEEVAGIRSFAGFRTATTAGEREALAVVAGRLAAMPHLTALGLDLEEQVTRTPFGLIPRDDRLWLTVDGVDHEVPAVAPAAFSFSVELVPQFDSDGVLGDEVPDPVDMTAPAVVVGTPDELLAMPVDRVAGTTLVVRFSAIDRSAPGTAMERLRRLHAAQRVADLRPDALLLVTEFSDRPDAGRGLGATWIPVEDLAAGVLPPRLVVRLEDLAFLGIAGWEDLVRVESARVRWDADVVSPGETASLIATIPGRDRTRSVILGCHLDSLNTPGALDDASGIAALLEVARVIDRARVTPPVDLILAFFGYEEGGGFGSARFSSTHESLLDRALAMVQVDCLTSPAEGLPRVVAIEGTPPAVAAGGGVPWPDYLAALAARRGVQTTPAAAPFGSDNMSFQGFDVPNGNVIAWDPYSEAFPIPDGQLHVPYDDVPLVAREMAILEDMVTVALGAALSTGVDDPELRSTPPPDRRAVMVASHCEIPMLSPAGLTELSTTLASAGFDVDVVPYGSPATPEGLAGADLVMVMPVFDAPVPEAGTAPYDESWASAELDALEGYVAGGGLLLLTHARGTMMGLNLTNPGVTNEDADDDNAPAARFGIRFDVDAEPFTTVVALPAGGHPLVEGVGQAVGGLRSGVPVEHDGVTLLTMEGSPVLAVVPIGGSGGEVLAAGDLGLFSDNYITGEQNLDLWLNLAAYARGR